MADEGFAFMFGFFISFLIFAIIFLTINEDNVDIDNELGPYMCESHGLEFVSAEGKIGIEHKSNYLKVVCQEYKPETAVEDNYLFILE